MHTISLLLFALAIGTAGPQSPAADMNDRGLAAAEKRDFATAEKLYLLAIAEWEKQGPEYAAHVAIVKMNLAQVYGAEGRRAECAATLEESLAGFRRTLGIRDLRSLAALNILGGMYMMLGNHTRAEALFREALPIERELYPQDTQMARTIGGLASLHMREGRTEQAIPLAEEALAIIIKAEGENTLDAALAYANIAEGHRVLNRPDRALPLFRKSRTLYERLLGKDHPRVSSVLTQEGLLLLADGKLGMAEEVLERSLEIVVKSCPKCSFERAAAENNLALLRIRQGKLAEADRLLTNVLALQERAPEMPKSEMAVTLQSLAVVRQREKRYEDAERLKRRAALLLSSYR
jgi:tetratricopeptide (TPR) repeat protein